MLLLIHALTWTNIHIQEWLLTSRCPHKGTIIRCRNDLATYLDHVSESDNMIITLNVLWTSPYDPTERNKWKSHYFLAFYSVMKMYWTSSYFTVSPFCFRTLNTLNSTCCVTTVCHQVRCMYWGHLGHFHWAMSHLNWYKSYMKMFFVYLQSGVPRHLPSRFIAILT